MPTNVMEINMSEGIVLNFESIFTALTQHFWAGMCTVLLIILFLKRDDLTAHIKVYLTERNVSLDKRTSEITKINDVYRDMYKDSTKALDKISEAIVSFKEALLLVESRLGEKISYTESSLHKKIDSEMELIRNQINDDRIKEVTTFVKEKSNPNLDRYRQSYPNDKGVKSGVPGGDRTSNI